MNNYKIKLLDINDEISNMIFSSNNKREYINCDYYDLVLNNNSYLNIIFEANIYDFNPNEKIFLQISRKDYNNYEKLINKVKKDLIQNVIHTNSLYVGKNNSCNNYILADINKSKNNIYTKLFKIINNKFEQIDIKLVPNNFRAILSVRIKSILEKNNDWMLNNELYQIIIKGEINLANNKNQPDDLNLINDFLYN